MSAPFTRNFLVPPFITNTSPTCAPLLIALCFRDLHLQRPLPFHHCAPFSLFAIIHSPSSALHNFDLKQPLSHVPRTTHSPETNPPPFTQPDHRHAYLASAPLPPFLLLNPFPSPTTFKDPRFLGLVGQTTSPLFPSLLVENNS